MQIKMTVPALRKNPDKHGRVKLAIDETNDFYDSHYTSTWSLELFN